MKLAALYARVSSARQQLNENIASQAIADEGVIAACDEQARRRLDFPCDEVRIAQGPVDRALLHRDQK